ncbi:MAG TPA: hypothetical protein ENH57_04540, partial [Actinobacteria bacterium]|nr:hypothetical protein [Actinomycetota bacterium]
MKNKSHFFASILILTMILSSFPSQALDDASTNNGAPGFVFPNLNTPQVAKQAKKKESSKASEVKTKKVPVKKIIKKRVLQKVNDKRGEGQKVFKITFPKELSSTDISKIIKSVNKKYGQEVIKKDSSGYIAVLPSGVSFKEIERYINGLIKNIYKEKTKNVRLIKFPTGLSNEEINQIVGTINDKYKEEVLKKYKDSYLLTPPKGVSLN